MKIAIAGGSGFVGRRLVSHLLAGGHTVSVLTRNPSSTKTSLAKELSGSNRDRLTIAAYDPYDPSSWATAIAGCEGIVNLAGESLTEGRWTAQKKDMILRSRAETTRNLVSAIATLAQKPKVLVSASAIGFYGPHDNEVLDESSPGANDFLADVCKQWEAAAANVVEQGVRLVQIRIGIVLGPDGGALGKMLGFFQMFVGGPIGSGRQWLSWIHQDDLAGAIAYALENDSVSGTINATAPNPVPMSEFSDTLGKVMARPSWFPVPSIALELVLGEAAQIVLTGQRVVPKRTQELGYQFKYPQLKAALRELLVER